MFCRLHCRYGESGQAYEQTGAAGACATDAGGLGGGRTESADDSSAGGALCGAAAGSDCRGCGASRQSGMSQDALGSVSDCRVSGGDFFNGFGLCKTVRASAGGRGISPGREKEHRRRPFSGPVGSSGGRGRSFFRVRFRWDALRSFYRGGGLQSIFLRKSDFGSSGMYHAKSPGVFRQTAEEPAFSHLRSDSAAGTGSGS